MIELKNLTKIYTTKAGEVRALDDVSVTLPDKDDVAEIVEEHLLKGRPVERLEYHEKSGDHHAVSSLSETTFYKKQKRVALRNCGVINPEDVNEYIATEGEQEFETPIWANGHTVLYFIPQGVEVVELKYRESGYDSDFVGSFACDNDFCNNLWKKAQRTLYVTMRDNYMDCPDRERAQWWGDVVVELGEAGYVFDSKAHLLTRKAILELMNWQQPNGVIASPVPGWYKSELPCQMLASVGYYGFYTYYMLTGDNTTIDEIYPRVRKYLFEVWNPQNSGLINIRRGGWYWGDWGKNIDKEVLQQCWYAVALKGFIQMAKLTNHRSDAMMAEQEAARKAEERRLANIAKLEAKEASMNEKYMKK